MLGYFKTFFYPTEQNDELQGFHPGPQVVLIHGANQSSKSFGYIASNLPDWNITMVNYSCYETFDDNLHSMINLLSSRGPLFLVGHSLGGIYAAHLSQHLNVVGGVTLSAPYGGSSMADWAKYIVPGYPLLRDVGRRSKPIQDLKNFKIKAPWLQLVSASGHVPWINEPNDGVLTINSMRALPGIEYQDVDVNHYEIMCDNSVIDIIVNRYYNIIQ